MDRDEFASWLDEYGEAWDSRDADRLSSLFADDAVYVEMPFDRPFCGRQAIASFWTNVTKYQEDIDFDYQILTVDSNVGIAHVDAAFTYRPSEKRTVVDGIFVVSYDEDGRCVEFRQWWHTKKE